MILLITLIVFFCLYIIGSLFSLSSSYRIEGAGIAFVCFSIIVLIAATVIDIGINPTPRAYRLGQINALSGKIEYQRELQPDSTIEWVYIGEKKND